MAWAPAFLSTPLGLAHHQRRHLLSGASAVGETEAVAAARIPANREELGLQVKQVFCQPAEHTPTHTVWIFLFGTFTDHHPPPYRPIRGRTFAGKAKSITIAGGWRWWPFQGAIKVPRLRVSRGCRVRQGTASSARYCTCRSGRWRPPGRRRRAHRRRPHKDDRVCPRRRKR